jgi:hypothetical protein
VEASGEYDNELLVASDVGESLSRYTTGGLSRRAELLAVSSTDIVTSMT